MLKALISQKVVRQLNLKCPSVFKESSSITRCLPLAYQAASISSKHTRDRSIEKPAPWPYKEKKYRNLHILFGLDPTLSRFDENTQLIVVEGNIGCGKTSIAKRIADEFEMEFFPEPSVDSLFVDGFGFDWRTIDHLLPPSFKCCDLKTFYKDPHHCNVTTFQLEMYRLRLEQYLMALAHVLNTGQGVVMERSVFSDYVFMEAMHKMGYLSAGAKSYYTDVKANSLHDVDLKPTLVIYLDVDVDTIMDRIKKRNIDYEVNSKVLTKEYLSAIEHYYKQDYLKYISKHSELMVYDWSQFGDIEAVVDDIERLDLDKYDKYDYKLKAWRNRKGKEWDVERYTYTNKRYEFLAHTFIPRFDVPEAMATPEDMKVMAKIGKNLANTHFEKGFNPDMGEKGWLFKSQGKNYWDRQKYEMYFGQD